MVANPGALDVANAGESNSSVMTSEWFRVMFEVASDAMLVVDEEQRIRLANNAVTKLFGIPLEVLQGMTFEQLIPERFRPEHRAHVARFGETGQTKRSASGHLDVIGLRADGVEIPIGVAISTFVDQGRRFYAASLRSISHQKRLEEELRDINQTLEGRVQERTAELRYTATELNQQAALRVAVEAELRERELRFKAVFNNAFSFLGLLRPDGTLLEANQQALSFFGIAKEDVVGRPFWETPWWQYSTDSRSKLIDGIQRAARGEFVRFEMQDHDPKDGIVDIDFSLTPVKDDSGNVVFLVPEGHKITELKDAQRELRKARDSLETLVQARTEALQSTNELLSTILDSVDEGIVVFDRECRVQFWNRFLERATHMTQDEIKGKRTWDVWPGLRTYEIEKKFQRVLAGETVINDRVIGRDVRTGDILPPDVKPHECDERTVWMLTKYTPLRKGNEIVGGIGTSLNLGTLIVAQSQLQATNEKLRSLNAHLEKVREEERTRIARGIHDGLGGLITGIRAHVSTVIDADQRANRPVDARLTRACELADSAADAVRRVIADLRPSVLDQLGLWAALEWLNKETATSAGLENECIITDEAHALTLDKLHAIALFRTVQEALTNIVRHSGATRCVVEVSVEDDMLIASVEDNGKGIPDTELMRGDAWGLIGMQERARQVGGDLRIERSREGGTLVILRVPVPDDKSE